MEHRYGKRNPIRLQVLLYKQGIPVAIGCVSNISQYGLFIDTEFDDVDENQILEIELTQRIPGASRWRATLVHKGIGGLGFEFHAAPDLSTLLAESSLHGVSDTVSYR